MSGVTLADTFKRELERLLRRQILPAPSTSLREYARGLVDGGLTEGHRVERVGKVAATLLAEIRSHTLLRQATG